MVNHAEIRNEDGSITVKLRNESGELNLRKVGELVSDYPRIFSQEDSAELLGEIIGRSLSLEKEVTKLRRRVNFLEDEKNRATKRSLYGDVKNVRKDLDLFRMINAKKPRGNARETIRREMELYDEEEDEVEDTAAGLSLQTLKIG